MVRRVSGLANDKAVSSCLDDFDRDNLDVVDAQGELASHIGHVRQRLHAHSLRHKAPQKLRQIIPQTTLKSKDKGGLTLKVSEKGGVSLYGMGRFPVTLYKEQWLRILASAPEIESFIRENDSKLKTKE